MDIQEDETFISILLFTIVTIRNILKICVLKICVPQFTSHIYVS